MKNSYWSIWKEIALLAYPGVIGNIMNCLGNILVLRQINSLSSKYVAGIGLGTTLANFIVFVPLQSFCQGLQTLFPQCLGKREFQLCGEYLNKGLFFIVLIGMALLVLLSIGSPALYYFGFSQEILPIAVNYSYLYSVAIIISLLSLAHFYFLQAHKCVVRANTLLCSAAIIQACTVYLALRIHPEHYMSIGVGIISEILITLGLYIFISYWSQATQKSLISWNIFSIFKKWRVFFTVCLETTGMFVLDGWAFHVMGIFVGRLSAEELAAHPNLLNILSILFIFPLAIGNITVNLVGEKLGEGKPQEAKHYAYAGIILNIGLSLFFDCCVLGFSTYLAQMYTPHPEIQEIIRNITPIIVLTNVFDTIQGIFLKIIQALSKQRMGIYALAISHWVVRIPAVIFLTFTLNLGIYGIWWTYSISYGVAILNYGFIIFRQDWVKVSSEIRAALDKEKTSQNIL